MRKFIFFLVLFLAIVFIFLSFSELKSIIDTLEKSNWIFLTFAFLFECLWLFNASTTFGVIYRLVDLKETRSQLFLMTVAANFVNVIAPSAGIGGMAVFLDNARRRNQPTARVTVVGVLFVIYDYASFLCVLTLGLVVLIRRNNLTAGEITATCILLLIACAMASLLFLGYSSSEKLGRVLARLVRMVNWIARPFIHREYLQEAKAHAFARDAAEGIALIRGKRKELFLPFLFALNSKALLICVLAFTFLALGTPFSVGTLVGGFSIGYLFLIVSPTPSGVGVVESILPVAFRSLRVPWAAAVLITLVYRGITFWFPLLVGLIAFRILHNQSRKQDIPSRLKDSVIR
jgi:glycosyltransferase 2 family protein